MCYGPFNVIYIFELSYSTLSVRFFFGWGIVIFYFYLFSYQSNSSKTNNLQLQTSLKELRYCNLCHFKKRQDLFLWIYAKIALSLKKIIRHSFSPYIIALFGNFATIFYNIWGAISRRRFFFVETSRKCKKYLPI